MPVWGWVAIGGGAVLLVGAAVVGAVFGWRAYVRRRLLELLVKAEAVDALASALRDSFERLANSSDEEMEAFAGDVSSVERHALEEIRDRSNLLATELDRMPLPRSLIPVAQDLADAAYTVCEQSSQLRSEDIGDAALEALLRIDLERMNAYVDKALRTTAGAREVYGLGDTAVYGGGLYL